MKNEFVKQHPHTLGLDYHTLIKYILGNKTNKYLPLIVKQIHNVSEDMMKRYNGEVNDEYVAYLKKYGIEDAKNYSDLEVKIAQLYSSHFQ